MSIQQTIEVADGKTIIRNVQAPTFRKDGVLRQGPISAGQHLEIRPGTSVRLFGDSDTHDEPQQYDLTFRIGDQAEYHSYNYHYLGTIVSIGRKTITIEYEHGSTNARKRLSWWEFSWRNKRFDAARIAARNLETSQCI